MANRFLLIIIEKRRARGIGSLIHTKGLIRENGVNACRVLNKEGKAASKAVKFACEKISCARLLLRLLTSLLELRRNDGKPMSIKKTDSITKYRKLNIHD